MAVRRRLTAALAGAAAALLPAGRARAAGPTTADLSEARRRLEEVYARPPLDQLDKPRSDSLLDRLARALGGLFSRAGSGDRTVFLILGALLLALLVWLVLRNLRGISAGTEPRLRDRADAAGSDPDAEWEAALAAAARGDHREAVRRAFRSALLAVARRGRLAVDPAWTTRELLAHTRADPDLLAALAPASAAFDLAWYSGRPVSAADWELQRTRCEAVRSLAGGRAARSPEAVS
ncbi:MAG TPA: DUF4129 domain-containing protein [Candidatus Dormibacteraeota bacterium]